MNFVQKFTHTKATFSDLKDATKNYLGKIYDNTEKKTIPSDISGNTLLSKKSAPTPNKDSTKEISVTLDTKIDSNKKVDSSTVTRDFDKYITACSGIPKTNDNMTYAGLLNYFIHVANFINCNYDIFRSSIISHSTEKYVFYDSNKTKSEDKTDYSKENIYAELIAYLNNLNEVSSITNPTDEDDSCGLKFTCSSSSSSSSSSSNFIAYMII